MGNNVKVKEEDTDWIIYHIIAREPAVTIEKLVAASGLDAAAVESSLARLQQSLLVDQTEDKVRVLSFGESLIKTQVKYSDDFPIVFENGVIKEKKRLP
jgi:DNA-binding IclR family transcriptional regulator